jgi:hypothetical protein
LCGFAAQSNEKDSLSMQPQPALSAVEWGEQRPLRRKQLHQQG